MSKTRGPYPPEFRWQMVELVRSGRTPESLSREFEPTAESIRNWVRQADRDEGLREDGLRTDEREVFDYIEGFYNPRRRHSSLGQVSPMAFENNAPESRRATRFRRTLVSPSSSDADSFGAGAAV